jgi:XTP/dITP diphosphohydrolase
MSVGAAAPPGRGRIVLVVTSPRSAPGLLTWPAWNSLRQADQVYAADPDPSWLATLNEAGVRLEDLASLPAAQRAGQLLEATDGGHTVVWFGSPDGDPGLTDALAEHLARRAVASEPPEVEMLIGSHDLPGARLLDLVAVMDRLRSPGGCPWDAEQTHHSLLPFLLEETYEVIEAVEAGAGDAETGIDRAHLAEELGDLLLQVVFHARIAEEDAGDPFTIDDVAGGIVAKLVNRHPHVFADVSVEGAEEVARNWEEIKAEEKQRAGLLDGIPTTLPALARAQKILDRLERDVADEGRVTDLGEGEDSAAEVARELLRAVQHARRAGVDAEATLRRALARLASTN